MRSSSSTGVAGGSATCPRFEPWDVEGPRSSLGVGTNAQFGDQCRPVVRRHAVSPSARTAASANRSATRSTGSSSDNRRLPRSANAIVSGRAAQSSRVASINSSPSPGRERPAGGEHAMASGSREHDDRRRPPQASMASASAPDPWPPTQAIPGPSVGTSPTSERHIAMSASGARPGSSPLPPTARSGRGRPATTTGVAPGGTQAKLGGVEDHDRVGRAQERLGPGRRPPSVEHRHDYARDAGCEPAGKAGVIQAGADRHAERRDAQCGEADFNALDCPPQRGSDGFSDRDRSRRVHAIASTNRRRFLSICSARKGRAGAVVPGRAEPQRGGSTSVSATASATSEGGFSSRTRPARPDGLRQRARRRRPRRAAGAHGLERRDAEALVVGQAHEAVRRRRRPGRAPLAHRPGEAHVVRSRPRRRRGRGSAARRPRPPPRCRPATARRPAPAWPRARQGHDQVVLGLVGDPPAHE